MPPGIFLAPGGVAVGLARPLLRPPLRPLDRPGRPEFLLGDDVFREARTPLRHGALVPPCDEEADRPGGGGGDLRR